MFEALKQNDCPCGKEHSFGARVIIEKGGVNRLPGILLEMGLGRAFIIADKNTYFAAGEKVAGLLEMAGIKTCKYIFAEDTLEPDERATGRAVMNFNSECDVVIGVGSGVINDIGKIVSAVSGKPYVIVATAPSVDGYASATSSMIMEGVKVTVNSKCPDVIIGDTEILSKAPVKMTVSGLGDMLAKYVSICEWRISALINGEYYCESIATLVRAALKKCIDNKKGLLSGDEESVKAVFEGLLVAGAAMSFAGTSRPASGIEHYLSHIWDMRGVELGAPVELHGIQCALGTLIAVKLYKKIKAVLPNREKARSYALAFDYSAWAQELRLFLGKGASSMIALEEREQKYDVHKHEKRIDAIIRNWDGILKIISEELPSVSSLEELFDTVGLPKTPEDAGFSSDILCATFKATKDIRDKYVLSRLFWDLGIIDEVV